MQDFAPDQLVSGRLYGIEVPIVVSLEDIARQWVAADDPVQHPGLTAYVMVCGDLPDLIGIGSDEDDQVSRVVNRVHADALRHHIGDAVGADGPRANGRHPEDGGHG
ncbi:hypothetical protein QLQ12_07885 [Actinoplanes sp. NEAU-A12]|uniref:Uncharacterized protein n=1 Tax=Actinoplanes sandaracinus TaxID=3045177 RepID=A0ABT6WFN9_9ACTN|nr:hypothetical protein [Actinoplanes sandaracinus]MDI6098522.1 hypothetical protein [Actinoplanes sandaracinus]